MSNEKIFINDAEEIVPPVNDSPYKRILAIGDVHAAFGKLTSLWKKISVTDDDLVIFLGDYLYGLGDKNVETLYWLLEHKKRKNIIFVRGNVDETYIYHLFDNDGKISRINSGVARDIKLTAVLEPYFPQEVYNFLTGLPLNYSVTVGGRKYFFCHAGINVDAPLDAQTKTYLLNHPKLKSFYRDYSGETVIVVGHKSPKKIFTRAENLNLNRPIKIPSRNILLLDTDAKKDGPLSCVDVLSGEIWQSDDDADNDFVDGILFVCSGNSCRSPMAKYVMRNLLAQNSLAGKIFVDFAGCNTRGGGLLSKGAREVLSKHHIPFGTHISKPFTAQEYQKFKCVVAMDSEILQSAKKKSDGDISGKIRLLADFDSRAINVDDPFHTGDYETAYKLIELGCSALLKEILAE